jgi:hypothetical protein
MTTIDKSLISRLFEEAAARTGASSCRIGFLRAVFQKEYKKRTTFAGYA